MIRPRVIVALVALVLTAALSWVVWGPSPFNVTPPGQIQKGPLETDGDPNDILVFEDMRVRRWLVETIVRAAQVTGADPAYLMALADKESSLIPHKEARSSSAEGLFQFIDSTWLEVLRRYGPKHGYEREANAIKIVDGRPVVRDGKKRARLLSLRRDPYLSALMAGEMINTHAQILAGKVARDPTFAELYMAHLLGVNGAKRFVELLEEEPEKTAHKAFPSAARTNRSIFFAPKDEESGERKPLTIAEVQERLDAMIADRVARYASVRGGSPPATN